MTNPEFRTLAYSKSPKTTRRTTFQDELQAAVSARASKATPSMHPYYDDFEGDDDDDDFLQKLLKLRKEKTGALKSAKSKSKSSTFDLSDDESKDGKTKKVSFLKTQRTSFFSNNTTGSESQEVERPDSSVGGHANYSDSFASTNASEDDTELKSSHEKPADHQNISTNLSDSLSYQTSGDTLLDLPLPLPSDGSVGETPGPEEKSVSSLTPPLSTSDLNHTASAGDVSNREPPKPKPRQRTLGLSLHAVEKPPEETENQDISRPQTSSASIPLSNDTSSVTAVRSCSPQWANEDRTVLSSNKSEQSQLVTKSTLGSGSRDGFLSDDSKEQERHCFTSFEEPNHFPGDRSDQLSHVPEKSSETKTSGSGSQTTHRSQSACSRQVESKYLGRLKVLDQKLQDSEPQAADSLRAAVYQEWLQKKKESSRENMQIKKKEEIQKETKKREQETKKEDAILSYNAWKDRKKESLKAKAKEKQDLIRKEQQAAEDKEEKRQSAKQVFEKWKRERDHLLKEKCRKHQEAENKLKMKKQEQEQQRRQDSTSAFSNWSEKKKNVLHEKHAAERKLVKNKAQEEQYMKEEREKMALEMYENWLARKELEQKRQREERLIQSILQDNPPWSPPNKTIPFGK
ncbi:microtubule-associated protein 9 [Salarias fasciatus]|uniref:Microtubule-associated protein 9 n=1 Tax=Salarias fasciatus TaxID=181472 RepID=A0A672JFW6_SALFA|nr:microtubule-associated protein 9 [Salarias fasciatus]